jgi:type 1 glutamine amidotransferase
MTQRILVSAAFVAVLMAPLVAQQPAAVPSSQPPAGAEIAPIHVFLRAGIKSHGEGLHDYPQFLADWSKLLTDKGAVVDGGLHFPDAEELAGVDVIVMYKGDAGYMTDREKATLETFLKRGGGLVSFHDTLCGPDPEWFSTIVGGGKKHGEVNFSAGEIKYTIVDKASPIMQGMSDFSITDEAFFKMTFAPNIHVLATAPMPASGEVVPQIWTYERTMFGGQPFRAFVWMQGHTYTNLTHPMVEPMILRGIAWAAKRPIDMLVEGRPARGGGGGGGRGRAGAPGGRAGRAGGAPAGRSN